jgi:ABC-2 type transport system permease protein
MSGSAAPGASVAYFRFELVRTARNRRFLLFSVAFPLLMFFLIAGPNRNETIVGIPLPAYFMAGMLAWGSMSAVMAGGARIALDRSVGWQRQLRITPLAIRSYFTTKVASGYALAMVTIVALYLAGATMGVRLAAETLLSTTGLILIALVPFAILGVLLGHLLTPDSMGPAMGGMTALFAMLGGAWGPLVTSGLGLTLVQLLPSYWLVQAGQSSLTEQGWPAKAWLVVAVWSVVLGLLTVRAYQRDTRRG